MASDLRTCYRHPDQVAGVVCQRCDKPLCPHCMNQASVGFHCPDCTRKGAQKVFRGTAALRARPVLTTALIAVNVAVFVLGVLLSGGRAVQGASDLNVKGGLFARGFIDGHLGGVAEGEWYRLVTSGFLHYGFFHLGINMYALWVLGNMLEGATGRLRFGLIYGVSLLSGALGALILSPDSLTAGASGAIYGLLGAALSIGRSRGIPIRNSPVLGVLLFNLLLTFGLSRYISVGGHVGGLIGGFIAGYLLFDLPARMRAPSAGPGPVAGGGDSRQAIGVALCAVLAVVFVAASLVVAGNA